MAKKKIYKKDFKKIKFLVLDFDGVLTDNKVYVDQDGKETVCCSRGDGLGIGNAGPANFTNSSGPLPSCNG